MRKFEN